MIGLDTNVLLRVLLRDDATQLQDVESLLTRLASKGEHAHVSVPVITEIIFVLLRLKKQPKAAIISGVRTLLDAAVLVIEQEDAIRDALDHWANGKGGFNDYLIGALNSGAGCAHTASFDAALVAENPSRYKLPA